jgi:tetratricopeptide (TPR) repeat protein
MLQSYSNAAVTLEDLLQRQPDNYVALLNHAVAELHLKEFEKSKEDYIKLRKLQPRQAYVADLGLADIAAAQKNTAEEIGHLKRCVKSAPADSGAHQMALTRLAKLQGH